MTLPSYSDIVTIGHKMVMDILDGPVVVEEKVDGSQWSFALLPSGIQMRSKGQDQTNSTDALFGNARAVVSSIAHELTPGWIYRGEYLQKPHHNALTYDRHPNHHIVIFDIEIGPGQFLNPTEKREEVSRLDLECVPCYYEGVINPADLEQMLSQLLDNDSFLGGQKIEGVVIKNYNRFGQDHKVMMAKYVSDRFKEVHRKTWGESNPSQGDFVMALAQSYRTEARWGKAIQHLRERGELQDAPQDIGNLIREVNLDILKEEREEIAFKLFEHFWKQISRVATTGLPQWYKDRLLGNVTDPLKSFQLDAPDP